jgi:hypothetical protein
MRDIVSDGLEQDALSTGHATDQTYLGPHTLCEEESHLIWTVNGQAT